MTQMTRINSILWFLAVGACVTVPEMQGGASTITGDFTPEQAKALMAQKKVLPASQITTKRSRSAATNQTTSRVVHKRHFLTQQGHLYPPMKFLPLLRAEGIAADVVLHSEEPSFVPTYVGSGIVLLAGGVVSHLGVANEKVEMEYTGAGLIIAGALGYAWVTYLSIMDTHTISTKRKEWAIQWNKALADKLKLDFNPDTVRSVIFLGNEPLD